MLTGVRPATAQFLPQHNLDPTEPFRRTTSIQHDHAWGWQSLPRRRGGSPTMDGNVPRLQGQYGAIPLIVTVPGAMGRQGTPTGLVFTAARLCRDQ